MADELQSYIKPNPDTTQEGLIISIQPSVLHLSLWHFRRKKERKNLAFVHCVKGEGVAPHKVPQDMQNSVTRSIQPFTGGM